MCLIDLLIYLHQRVGGLSLEKGAGGARLLGRVTAPRRICKKATHIVKGNCHSTGWDWKCLQVPPPRTSYLEIWGGWERLPRLLAAQAVFNRQRGNLAGKQSLAHSHFFYGILLKGELESYSFLLVIVPWEPGVNRPSLRWVGWSFKESQRFTHPFPHNQLGESPSLGARSHQERQARPELGTSTGRAAGGGALLSWRRLVGPRTPRGQLQQPEPCHGTSPERLLQMYLSPQCARD